MKVWEEDNISLSVNKCIIVLEANYHTLLNAF